MTTTWVHWLAFVVLAALIGTSSCQAWLSAGAGAPPMIDRQAG
ncbi:MAG: hypothetical protein AAF713_12500 [Pseudomonadota bacterium]